MKASINFKFLPVVIFFLAALFFFFERCAVRQPPPGGPEDKTPPKLLKTFPNADSTNIKYLEYLEFQFDESIDRGSVRDQVWLLPELPNPPEIKWKGNKKFRVVLKDSLEKEQTYILTIGTGVKDLQGNKLNEPIVLPFSTGPMIDRGEISGRVIGESVQDVFIYAYRIEGDFPDSVIFTRKPRYYTQMRKSGEFRIKYIKPATYRIYALDDQDGNRLYTLQTDRIGIPFANVVLTSGKISRENINFTLVSEDTTAPQIVRARSLNNTKVGISFNEELDPQQNFTVEITDSVNGMPLSVFAQEIDETDRDRLIVYTASQQETQYIVTLLSVKDVAGNYTTEEMISVSFKGATEEDTTTTKLIQTAPANNQRNIRYDSRIELTFSHPADTNSLKPGFQLYNQDSLAVAGHWNFFNLRIPYFIPDSIFHKGETSYYTLDLANIPSVYGNAFGDSTFSYQFTTWDWADLGDISGTVRTENSNWKKAIVEANPFKGQEQYFMLVNTNEPYQISYLPEGFYRVKAMVDINENGKYDPGQTLPFEFAEPFLIYPDTVKVRKRWTTEGINFHFNP
jgi:uncharacterized protein (DUF2141 family)